MSPPPPRGTLLFTSPSPNDEVRKFDGKGTHSGWIVPGSSFPILALSTPPPLHASSCQECRSM
eukprot:scaffold25992_cov135-Isochrysis_galbana.AAC.6